MRKIVFISMFLLISSCAFAETNIDSQAELKAPIEQEQQGDTSNAVKATVGNEFVITLDANITTGYEWQIADKIDEKLINLVNSEYVPQKTGLVGSGGKSVWTFKAIQAGNTQISFKYIRPWEKDTPPAKEAIYTVDIQADTRTGSL